MKPTIDDSPPTIQNLTVKRRYLTEREVERLIEAAKSNRHGHRDATMVLVAYRHGFRASEVCDLLDISEANQRVLLHRARTKARAALERYLDSPDGVEVGA